MAGIKLTQSQMLDIYDGRDIDGFEYELIDDGDSSWVDDGKFQSGRIIFKHDGKFYALYPMREGSYYSGYDLYFFEEEAVEVEKREITKVDWVEVV